MPVSLVHELQSTCSVSGLRVLVADDDPDVLQDVAAALEVFGASVTRAESGADLMIRLGENEPFDLIVTDVAMPWMTGLQAVQSTRYAGLETPVIVMTALRDPAIPDRVHTLGGHALLLQKPFGMPELRAAIERLIPHASQEREM